MPCSTHNENEMSNSDENKHSVKFVIMFPPEDSLLDEAMDGHEHLTVSLNNVVNKRASSVKTGVTPEHEDFIEFVYDDVNTGLHQGVIKVLIEHKLAFRCCDKNMDPFRTPWGSVDYDLFRDVGDDMPVLERPNLSEN